MRRQLLSALFLAAVCAPSFAGQFRSLSADETRDWVRHIVPLPHRIDIRGIAEPGRGKVDVRGPSQSGPAATQAVRDLVESVGGCETGEAQFSITLQIGGPDASPLRPLPNNEQAYRIFPEPGYEGLRIVADAPVGLLYGAKTLAQLISARSSESRLAIPILRVTDWPDMSERGLWGSDSFLQLRRMGDMKLNVCEQISAVSVDESGRTHAGLKPGREAMIDEGPRHGVNPVPAILHLEQLSAKGIFEAFPELRATGGAEGAICFSQDAIVDVLAGWIAELGSLHGVSDVDVWLAENLHGKGGCRCEKCKPEDYGVLQVRAALKGWEKAKAQVPDVGLRILLSEETYRGNDLIIAELPRDVKLIYYHSLLTYTAMRRPMIYPLLVEYVRQGRWLGVSPQLTGNVGRATPFSGAQFVHYRMSEFVGKGLASFTAYVTPRLQHAWFNLEAAAEWSWNLHGRDAHEFAVAYAVRHEIPEPEKFADWSDIIGPVAWDLYGSEWPGGELRGSSTPVAKALRGGSLPELGEVLWGIYPHPWGQFASEQQLRDALTEARRALALAREIGHEETIQESLVIEGYARSLVAVWDLQSMVGPGGLKGDKRVAAGAFQDFVDGAEQAVDAVRAWSQLIAPEFGLSFEGRYWQQVEALERSAGQMKALANELGIEIE